MKAGISMINRIKKIIKENQVQLTHKNYPIDDFIFDEKLKESIAKKLSKYRDDFKGSSSNEKIPADLAMLMYIVPLVEELKYYYNNDLCFSVAKCISASEEGPLDLRTHSYYYENALFRFACFWEYLFIILNEFLQTELIVGHDTRNKIIEAGCHEIRFEKHGQGYKVVSYPISDELRKDIEPKLRKSKMLFNISQKKGSNTLFKAIKKQYSRTDRIQHLFDLYKCNEVKSIIELRNEIVHRRTLGSKFSIGPSDVFPGQCVDIKPSGWYDIRNLPDLLEKNLYVTRDALKTIVEILFFNEVPNSKENENKIFYGFEVKCNNCDAELCINEISVGFFIDSNQPLVCPKCKSTDTVINNKRVVNERYYFSNFKSYTDMLVEYWEDNERA